MKILWKGLAKDIPAMREGNHWLIVPQPDGLAQLHLVRHDGTGNWMEFSVEQLDALIEGLTEVRDELRKNSRK